MTSVHRLHGRVLALAIALGLAVAALIGIVLAIGNSKPQPPSLTGHTENGVMSRAATAPPLLGGNPLGGGGGGATGGGGGGGGGGTGGSGASGSLTVDTISLSPPKGWTVSQKNNTSVTLEDPDKQGLLGLLSGTLTGAPTAVQFAQSIVNATLQGTTDASVCGKVTKGPVPNGPSGYVVPLCYTIVPQNGQALQLYTIVIVAVSKNIGMVVKFITPANSTILNSFLSESNSVLPTVKWRLLT
jgi:hypothetical protein